MAEPAAGALLPEIPGKRLFRTDWTELPQDAPAWLAPSLTVFRADVGHTEYPCHFGRNALHLGELFGTWVEEDGDLSAMPAFVGSGVVLLGVIAFVTHAARQALARLTDVELAAEAADRYGLPPTEGD